jgi:hypothetical protein
VSLFAQQERIWIEGQVISADSLLPLKNVHIISRMARSGTISDDDGRFILRGTAIDTVYFSVIGYGYSIRKYRLTDHPDGKSWTVLLHKDTVMMEEVVVRSFYDWPTFKHLFVHMEPIKPLTLTDVNDELKDILLYMKPAPMTFKGPIQALYDLFNDMARLQRRLERNRKFYNDQLMREGRLNEMIPEDLEHVEKK